MVPCGPGECRIEVRPDLVIRRLEDDLAHDLCRIGHLRERGVAEIDFRRDGQVAGLGQPAADILDVFVDAKDLLVDQDDGEGTARGRVRVVHRHVAAGHRYPRLAGGQPVAIGVDRLRDRPCGRQGEAADQAGHHETAPRQRIVAQAGGFGQVVHCPLHKVSCYPTPRRGGNDVARPAWLPGWSIAVFRVASSLARSVPAWVARWTEDWREGGIAQCLFRSGSGVPRTGGQHRKLWPAGLAAARCTP